MTSYELIDLETGNLVGSYATEDEARSIARRAYEREGWEGVRGLGLLRVRDGEQELVAEDEELARDVVAASAVSPRP